MKRIAVNPLVTVALLAAGLLLAACDGTAPVGQETGLAKPPAEQEAPASDNSTLVRLSDDLQVFELVGSAESIGPEAWTVAGVTFFVGEGTELKAQASLGDLVKVEIALQPNGQLFAREIQPAIYAGSMEGMGELEFVGVLQAAGDTEWTINGMSVQIGPGTELKAGMQPGDLVKVHALIGEGGALTAREIEPAEDEAEDKTESVGEFEFVGTVESIGPESWSVGGRTLAIAPGTEIKGQIAVGSPVKIHAVPQPDGTLLAREIEPAGTDDLGDDSQDDLSSEDGEDFKFYGIVEAIGADTWTIGGLTFTVTGATEFDSHILVGDMVKVELVRSADGSLTAKEIEEDNDDMSFDDDDQYDDNSGSGSDDDADSDDDNSGSDSDDDDDQDDDNSGSSGSDDD